MWSRKEEKMNGEEKGRKFPEKEKVMTDKWTNKKNRLFPYCKLKKR